MRSGKSVLALVPARGGSKGLPGKNIRPLGGKPLIAWTLEAAQGSGYVDSTVVTTDSEEIASVARAWKGEVPFLRPPEYASDTSPTSAAVVHALDWLEKERGRRYDILVLLQPTSPFRNAAHVDAALNAFAADPGAESLVSACEAEKSPYWTKSLGPDGYLRDFIPGASEYTRRQDLPKAYVLNGALYVIPAETFRRTRAFMGERTRVFAMDRLSSLDIDTPLDFEIAEFLAARMTASGKGAP